MKRNWRNKKTIDTYGFAARISARVIHRASLVVLAGLLVLLTACSGSEEAHDDTYTCPMHPTVISDRPGSCPVCGMDLVRKARPGEEIKITEDLSRLLKSPNEIVVASVNTIRGEYKSVPVSVEATGVVTYDSRNIYTIPARAGGRLERVFLKYNFQPVRKGQKVAEIYSPELVTAQRELLFLLDHDADNETLIQSARNKLELLGLTRSQIADVEKNREAQNTIAIFSPYNGYVIAGDQPEPSADMSSAAAGETGGMGGMGSGASATRAPQAPNSTRSPELSLIKEGSYVSAGETLFKIVNTASLRIELNIPGAEAAAISAGDPVGLTLGHGQTVQASVDFVQPFYTQGENFVKVRLYTTKTEELQVGQLVTASISTPAKESLWVPRMAVLDLGTQSVVFIRDREVLKPKTVVTGIRSDGMIEIKSGLASSEEIAANAQFLVDSESFIKPVK